MSRKTALFLRGLVVVMTLTWWGGRAVKRAQSIKCANMMFPFVFVAATQASDSGSDRHPTNIVYLANEVPVRWLICPSDSFA